MTQREHHELAWQICELYYREPVGWDQSKEADHDALVIALGDYDFGVVEMLARVMVEWRRRRQAVN
jgi:hypothetical protein